MSMLGVPSAPTSHTGSVKEPLHLYCLPYAGGSGRVFANWQKLFPPEIKVCCIDYPGHGARRSEPLLDRIDRIADGLAREIASRSHARYVLFGHSMGSLVGFEACHQLARYGAQLPELLAVSGHGGPRVPRSSPPMHAVPDDQFIAHLRELGATPPEILATRELMELLLPLLRADFRACETYEPYWNRKLAVPIAVYGGVDDEDADIAALRGWQSETSGTCVVRMFPGDHFFIADQAEAVPSSLLHDLRETGLRS